MTSSIESQFLIKHNLQHDLSEQELLDCSACSCSSDCFFSTLFTYLTKYGIGKDQSPNQLVDVKNATCVKNQDKIIVKGFHSISLLKNMYELLKLLANGTVTARFYVNENFATYDEGIIPYDDVLICPKGITTSINTLIVGYEINLQT